MIWRCSMYINGLVDGWTESVYHRDSQNNAAQVAGAFETIIAKRVRFLGAPYQVVAYKITSYSTNAGARPAIRSKYFVRKNFPTPQNTFGAEPGNVGCEVVMQDQAFAVSTRLTFGAPPDECVNIGGQVNRAVVPTGAPANFGSMVDDYAAALASTTSAPDWGWAAVGTPQDRGITSFTPLPSGQIAITLDNPLIAPIIVQAVYPARIRGVNRGKSNLNGPLLVSTTNLTTIGSEEAIAVGPSNVGGRIKVYPPVRTYTQYGPGGVLALQSVKHVRGRPFGISRGRRPVRPRA